MLAGGGFVAGAAGHAASQNFVIEAAGGMVPFSGTGMGPVAAAHGRDRGRGAMAGAALAGGGRAPDRRGVAAVVGYHAGAVAVDAVAGAVAGRGAARQVVGIARVARIAACAVVGCCRERNPQAAIAGAGGVGKGYGFGCMVGMAFLAGIGNSGDTVDRGVLRMAAVGGSGAVALVAIIR